MTHRGGTGGTTTVITIAVAALAIGFEQLVQWKYGPMGIIAFLLLSLGVKTRSSALTCIGSVIIVMLLTGRG
ncbi:hypothetical protein [Streptomyces odontomachi]|uniref:hypothetical protein n=1 Tax=Streptomyces odontomachi TaxID=2944940 RepID=UPI00210E98B1|nr:hypothetical protein [Streptomyces sp. ODS25]